MADERAEEQRRVRHRPIDRPMRECREERQRPDEPPQQAVADTADDARSESEDLALEQQPEGRADDDGDREVERDPDRDVVPTDDPGHDTTVVCRSAVRSGLPMWASSRLPPATSASMGVKSKAFVSLTSVISMPRSSAYLRSSALAVESPAKPPPTMTIRARTGTAAPGPRHASRPEAITAFAIAPTTKPRNIQPTSSGNAERRPTALHCAPRPSSSGSTMTQATTHAATPTIAPVVARSWPGRATNHAVRASTARHRATSRDRI